jgi:hypothetical protein
MKRLSRTYGAARLGLAALALGMQLAGPLATTTSAQSAPATTSVAAPQDAPSSTGVALQPRPGTCPDSGPQDYPVAGGWFFTQEAHGCITGSGPARRRGYLVQDDSKGAFWTEFRRYGGVDVLGYPVSQPYHYPVGAADGYLYQAFEKGILQWQPENGRAVLANVFDQFTEQKLDDDLAVLGIPSPKDPAATENDRQSWLTEPLFLARYFYDPVAPHSSDPGRVGQAAFATIDQAEMFFGLPQTMPDRLALLGPKRDDGTRVSLYPLTHSFMAQRFQKGGMEMFFDSSPQEQFGAPVWQDRPVFLDPTVVPGDARPGCIATTAVGLLARTIGSDKLIPSAATQALPLDPSHPWVDAFVPPLAQGQLKTSFQLTGTGFKAKETVTITLTSVPPLSTQSQTAFQPRVVTLPTVTTQADGSFDAVARDVPVDIYNLKAVGSGGDEYDALQPLDLHVSTVESTVGGQHTCGTVGLPVGN